MSGRTTITVDHAILVDMESCNKAIKKQLQVTFYRVYSAYICCIKTCSHPLTACDKFILFFFVKFINVVLVLQDGLEPLCNQVWNSLITVNNNYLSADLPLCKDKSDTCTWGDELDLQVFLEPIVSIASSIVCFSLQFCVLLAIDVHGVFAVVCRLTAVRRKL